MESPPVMPLSCLDCILIRPLVSDRLLEVTGTISATSDNKQVLDKLRVERERGLLPHQLGPSNSRSSRYHGQGANCQHAIYL